MNEPSDREQESLRELREQDNMLRELREMVELLEAENQVMGLVLFLVGLGTVIFVGAWLNFGVGGWVGQGLALVLWVGFVAAVGSISEKQKQKRMSIRRRR